jgi:hypothetical protein
VTEKHLCAPKDIESSSREMLSMNMLLSTSFMRLSVNASFNVIEQVY